MLKTNNNTNSNNYNGKNKQIMQDNSTKDNLINEFNKNNTNNNNNNNTLCLEKSTTSFSDEYSSYILSSDARHMQHNNLPSDPQKTYDSYVSSSRESMNQDSVYSDLSVIRTEEGLEMNLSANFEKPCENLGFWNNLKKNFNDYKNILKFNIIQTENEIKLEDFHELIFFGKKYVNEKLRFSGNLVGHRTFNALKNEILWFSYRNNFENLVYEKTIYTSDAGWGCMIRAGQMILAKAIMEYNKIENSCGFVFNKNNNKNLSKQDNKRNYSYNKNDNYFLNTVLLFMDNSIPSEDAREYPCFAYSFTGDNNQCLPAANEKEKEIENPEDLLFKIEKGHLNENNYSKGQQSKVTHANEKNKEIKRQGKNDEDFLVIIEPDRHIKNGEVDEDYMDNRINLDDDYIESKNKKNNNNYNNDNNCKNGKKNLSRQKELLLKDSKENKNLYREDKCCSSNNIYTKIKEANENKEWASQIKLNDDEDLQDLEDNDLFIDNNNYVVNSNKKSKSNNTLNKKADAKNTKNYIEIGSSDKNELQNNKNKRNNNKNNNKAANNKKFLQHKKVTPPFSIKNICDYSYKFSKGAGMWFSNNMIINILKDINDDKNPLHDFKLKHFESIIKQKEIYSEFYEKIICECQKDAHYIGSIYTTNVRDSGFSDYILINHNEAKEELFSDCLCFSDENLIKFEGNYYAMKTAFVVFISMRLGLSSLEPNYFKGLLELFDLPNNLGIIGSKGSKAVYFVGKRNEKHLIYIDPHYVQESDLTVRSVKDKLENYKVNKFFEIKIEDCTPSLTVGFFCGKPRDFKDLCEIISKLKHISEIIKIV